MLKVYNGLQIDQSLINSSKLSRIPIVALVIIRFCDPDLWSAAVLSRYKSKAAAKRIPTKRGALKFEARVSKSFWSSLLTVVRAMQAAACDQGEKSAAMRALRAQR